MRKITKGIKRGLRPCEGFFNKFQLSSVVATFIPLFFFLMLFPAHAGTGGEKCITISSRGEISENFGNNASSPASSPDLHISDHIVAASSDSDAGQKQDEVLEWFLASFGSGSERAEMETPFSEPERPIRCLTPLLTHYDEIREYLDPDTRARFKKWSQLPEITNEQIYISESGKFRLIYETEGPDSVWTKESGIGEPGVPDYIIKAAHYADSSYAHQVERLGYAAPTSHSLCGRVVGARIDIRFGDLRDGSGRRVYGYYNPATPSALFINSTFSDPGFQQNDDEDPILGALKVTIAHELKHAIQYATNCFSGDAGSVHWVEMDATMMENVVFPNVNDYYNYIGGSDGIFRNPQTRTPRAYSHVTFMLHYDEEYGDDFWVDVWDLIGEQYASGTNIRMIDAMEEILHQRDASLPRSLLRNYLWHFASGDRALDNYGFRERERYPTASVFKNFRDLPEEPLNAISMPYHSARFFEFQGSEITAANEVAFFLLNRNHPMGVGLLAQKKDGLITEYLIYEESDLHQKHLFPFAWDDIEWLGAVIMNTEALSTTNNVQLFPGNGHESERFLYGDIAQEGELTTADASAILQQTLWPVALSPFRKFVGDVSGDGSLTPYDAAWIYRVLHATKETAKEKKSRSRAPSSAPLSGDTGGEDLPVIQGSHYKESSQPPAFPVDVNNNGLGPEWELFRPVPPEAKSIFNAPGKKMGLSFISSPDKAPPAAERDTLTASLHILNEHLLPEKEMNLALTVPGSSDASWYSLFLELKIDFPPESGSTLPGVPIVMELSDVVSGNTEEALQGWHADFNDERLKLAFASSMPLASQTGSDHLLTLNILPENEGFVHFRISRLEIDEYDYAINHPLMDTLYVMEPVSAEPGEELPYSFVLKQNYPNPFNPETTIPFELPEPGHTTLNIFEVTGRKVATLVDDHLESGRHTISFDSRSVSGIASGIYIMQLSSGGRTLTRSISLIK